MRSAGKSWFNGRRDLHRLYSRRIVSQEELLRASHDRRKFISSFSFEVYDATFYEINPRYNPNNSYTEYYSSFCGVDRDKITSQVCVGVTLEYFSLTDKINQIDSFSCVIDHIIIKKRQLYNNFINYILGKYYNHILILQSDDQISDRFF